MGLWAEAGMALNGRESKFVFKQAMRDYLPNDVLFREKMGFAVPLADWFRGSLKQRVNELIGDPGPRDTGHFDNTASETMIRHHQSGLRDHSSIFWTLVIFGA